MLYKKLYNKSFLKLVADRESAVYYDVNEDFEGERNDKIVLLGTF